MLSNQQQQNQNDAEAYRGLRLIPSVSGQLWFEEGVDQHDQGNYISAKECFTEALTFDGNHKADATFYQGSCSFHLGDFKEAIDYFSKEHSFRAATSTAYCYFKMSYFKLAQEFFDNSLVFNITESQRAEVLRQKGFCFLKTDDDMAAIEHFTISIDINDNTYGSYLGRGIAYLNMKRRDDALSDFVRAVENLQGREETISPREALEILLDCYKRLDYPRILSDVPVMLLAFDPDDFLVWETFQLAQDKDPLASVYVSADPQGEEYLPFNDTTKFNKLILAFSDHGLLEMAHNCLYQRASDPNEFESLNRDQKVILLSRLARVNQELHEFQFAVYCYNKAMELNPTIEILHDLKDECLLKMKKAIEDEDENGYGFG